MGVGKVPGQTKGAGKEHRNLSGEFCRILHQRTSRGKEGLGTKTAKATAH